MGFELEPDYRISYYKPVEQMYVFLGKVADLECKTQLRLQDALSNGDTLSLLVREPANSRSSGSASKACSPFVTPVTKETSCNDDLRCQLGRSISFMDPSVQKADMPETPRLADFTGELQQPDQLMENPAETYAEVSRRTKERQIKFVVELVSLWRKLYNGVDLGTGETVRYSLEDAARLVGISKKSLDDYLL